MNNQRKLLNPEEILVFPPGKCILINSSYSSSPHVRANQNTVRVETGARNYLGDPSCIYNARSKYLLCAVNPTGACSNCSHYQRRLDLEAHLLDRLKQTSERIIEQGRKLGINTVIMKTRQQ